MKHDEQKKKTRHLPKAIFLPVESPKKINLICLAPVFPQTRPISKTRTHTDTFLYFPAQILIRITRAEKGDRARLSSRNYKSPRFLIPTRALHWSRLFSYIHNPSIRPSIHIYMYLMTIRAVGTKTSRNQKRARAREESVIYTRELEQKSEESISSLPRTFLLYFFFPFGLLHRRLPHSLIRASWILFSSSLARAQLDKYFLSLGARHFDACQEAKRRGGRYSRWRKISRNVSDDFDLFVRARLPFLMA